MSATLAPKKKDARIRLIISRTAMLASYRRGCSFPINKLHANMRAPTAKAPRSGSSYRWWSMLRPAARTSAPQKNSTTYERRRNPIARAVPINKLARVAARPFFFSAGFQQDGCLPTRSEPGATAEAAAPTRAFACEARTTSATRRGPPRAARGTPSGPRSGSFRGRRTAWRGRASELTARH